MSDYQTLLQIAAAGDTAAKAIVASTIIWGDRTQPIPPDQLLLAKQYYNDAIAEGNADAMLDVGAMYYVGRGVPQDYTKAFHWYTKAAEHGSVTAMSNLGYCYYYGRNIPVDMGKAFEMFSKAMEAGDAVSCYKLGDMYLYGKHVAPDADKAFQLYNLCYCTAAQDKPLDCYPDVCARLGRCYHHGQGTSVDLKLAEHFLREAKTGFQLRVDDGDTLTDGVLRRTTAEYDEVVRQLTGQT